MNDKNCLNIIVVVLFCIVVGTMTTRAEEVDPIEQEVVAALPDELPDMTRSMVHVRVSQIEADRFMPWRSSVPQRREGFAIVVSPGLFLVPEVLVRNHTAIEMRRAGSIRRVPAEVVHADERIGLAMLQATEPDWFSDALPLPVLRKIPQNGDFTLFQWGANDHLQVGIGTLLSIGFESIGDGIPNQLTYEVATSMRIDTTGTPILHDGKLAGLAMQFRGGRRTVITIAPDNITRFLDASEHVTYTGIPEPDFYMKRLADPVRRRFLGVPEMYEEQGIYVAATLPIADAEHGLEVGDVIVAWDGHSLDARGNYEHAQYGRIPFQHLVAQSIPGDHVPVTIVRDGTVKEVQVLMRTNDDVHRRIPQNDAGKPDDYVVSAGLIFRELTIDFLKAFGDNWERRADIDLTWHAYTHEDDPDDPVQRTVILVGVLADPINIGYRELRYRIVTHINGHKILSLADLAARLDQDGLESVTLSGMEAVPLRFDPEEVETANQRIQARFQIPALSRLTKTTAQQALTE